MNTYAHRRPGFSKGLWKLSLPIILQNLITFSLGLMDTFMVSQLGNEEMAAVSTANVPAFLLISLVFGMQSGVGILVSQYWGKGEMHNINRAMGVAAAIGSGITLLLAILFALCPVQIMDLLSNRHDLSLMGAPYLRFIGFSYVFSMLSSIYASVQRSVENPAFGMKLFGFSTILNTALNYLLIFGKCGCPALGVAGAAIATLLARFSEFVICVICALRSQTIPFDFAAFIHLDLDMTRRFLKYASPVVLNEAGWGMGTSLMTVVLGYTVNSVDMLAANAVIGNMRRLFMVACFGLGAAAGVLVGKAIGEGKSKEEVLDLSQVLQRFATRVGLILGIVALVLIPLLFQPVVFPMFKLFGNAAVISTAMAVTSFGTLPLQAYEFTAITGVLRGGGDTSVATLLDLGPQWLVSLTLTALCALVLQTGAWPIAIAMQLELLPKLFLCMWRVNGGKWIHDVTRSVK